MKRHVPFLCPRCGKPLARVVDTFERLGSIWRRRQCEEGHRTWTKEAMLRDFA